MSLPPASFFGMPLGLLGLGLAWRAAAATWALPATIGETILAAAVALWAALVALFAGKWLMRRDEAMDEFRHPVQCCFVGLLPVTASLSALALLPYTRPLAILLFVLGGLGTLAFALQRTGDLWRGERALSATTPVLYLPAVAGSFVTAIVAANVGLQSWGQLAFGAGAFSWLAIESVLLHRLHCGPEMPPALRPTLGIQFAPPSVGALAYVSVGPGASDMLSHALLGYALLQVLILLRLGRWIGAQPFGPSYWSFSFGAAALAGAATRLAGRGDSEAIAALAAGTIRLWLAGRLVPAPSTP
ncbi:MAG: dicarboxylate transporter/tellurite-resistance protein TehA [Reyranellaceae bacterium]